MAEQDPRELLILATARLREDASEKDASNAESVAMMALAEWFDELATQEPHVLRWQHGQVLGMARALVGDQVVSTAAALR